MNFSTSIKQSNTDEWFTTREDVERIVPFLLRGGYRKILCPFDKADSNYVKVLTENGFDVTYGHIADGQDFFDRTDLADYDAVVSNPPFSKREAILKRLYKSGVPFALILNFNGLFDSKTRWQMFKDNGIEILVPRGRMKFFNEECKGNSPNFQSVYVCKGMTDKVIEYIAEQTEPNSSEKPSNCEDDDIFEYCPRCGMRMLSKWYEPKDEQTEREGE